ncbi:hypothetical protein CB1_011932002 [Camelus ferus]|nr:hypothetical protein CB1_011932002 [Camelus ferus]
METRASREPDTVEVLPQHKFDCRSLEAYLKQHLPGFGAEPEAKLTVAQYRYLHFEGNDGNTPLVDSIALVKNLLFDFIFDSAWTCLLFYRGLTVDYTGSEQILRIDREFKVQKALFSTGFPVPKPLLYCSDASLIGTEFYVMEHVQGRIFRDFTVPGVSPAERSAIYVAMVETLAQLHSLNIQSLQLEGYGRGAGYCKRQVSTWTKQYQAAAHQDIPAMSQLSDWLMKNLPDNDNEENLIHGDFKLDNIVFHPKEVP